MVEHACYIAGVVVREVQVLARALAGEFGSPIRAADELRMAIVRDELDPRDRAIYLPPSLGAARPTILIAKAVIGWERERFVTLALAHHLLRHRRLSTYAWGESGPRFTSPIEAREADYFAECFSLALQGRVQPAAARLAVLASARGGR